MVFFKYLANILQHSSLSGCFQEDSENKTSIVFSLISAGQLQGKNMHTINLILKCS